MLTAGMSASLAKQMDSHSKPLTLDWLKDTNVILWDRSRRPEGGEWEPLKILQKNKVYVPNSIPTHLSSNRQGDTSQLVTSSS